MYVIVPPLKEDPVLIVDPLEMASVVLDRPKSDIFATCRADEFWGGGT